METVFYSLKNDKYQVRYDDKTVYIDKGKWNAFLDKQHNREKGNVSLAGSVNIELGELNKMLDN